MGFFVLYSFLMNSEYYVKKKKYGVLNYFIEMREEKGSGDVKN